MPPSKQTRYIIFPARSFQTTAAQPETSALSSFAARLVDALPAVSERRALSGGILRVIDSIRGDGPQLVEALPEDLPAMRAALPGVRIVPEVFYRPQVIRPSIDRKVTAASDGPAVKINVKVVLGSGNTPVRGARVVAFTDYEAGEGAEATTNAQGQAQLALGGSSAQLARLYIFPLFGAWPLLKKNVTLASGSVLRLLPTEFPFVDCVRHFYGTPELTVGAGVTVGIVDSGIAPHPDLQIAGGLNTVTGEAPNDFGASDAEGHGTHVAGIVAARGAAPTGNRGIAPGVTLRAYRVFGRNAAGASNFAITKAIDAAVADGCDLINMSLGGGSEDPLTSEAISEARAAGVVVLAANGNDERSSVIFPAAFDLCLAVSAMGRKGTFPAETAAQDTIAKPFGTDPLNFIAAFSNIGAATDLVGPGVGVISTVPQGYAVMSGTSMACPAATGALARLLARNPAVLNMPRNAARSNAIIDLLRHSVASLGFGALFEGSGMIRS